MTGLKASYVENQYKILHREILPFNWTDVIAGRSLLSVEESVGGLIVYPASDKVSYPFAFNSFPFLVTCDIVSCDFSVFTEFKCRKCHFFTPANTSAVRHLERVRHVCSFVKQNLFPNYPRRLRCTLT